MEDEFNQKIVDLVISMSDIAVYVVDVKQFVTVEQLIKVIKEANVLIGRVIDFFNKHKERGFFSEYSLIDFIHWFTYLKLDSERVFSAFPGKVQEELKELQIDFTRFRTMFDRGVSVQTLVTAKDIESQLKDLSKHPQAQFKHSWLTYLYLVLANEDGKLLDTLDTKHKT